LHEETGEWYPSNSDRGSPYSKSIGEGIMRRIGFTPYKHVDMDPQTVGSNFEDYVREYTRNGLDLLHKDSSWDWVFDHESGNSISNFYQYTHLKYVSETLGGDVKLQMAFGDDDDYIVKPDVVIGRKPKQQNSKEDKIEGKVEGIYDIAQRTPNRSSNNEGVLLLHASISCKWTLRSDRAQNARTEALNIIRNRKGRTPHVVAVTAEPQPSRISSIAMGTGDIDCTYHIALPELSEAVSEVGSQYQQDDLQLLLEGGRLRDISDLIFDLAV
jgi:hypothetical protein